MIGFNYSDFYESISRTGHYFSFVEVGVYAGDSILFLAEQLRLRGTPFDLHAVDLWERVNDETGYERKVELEVRRQFEARLAEKGLTDAVKIIQEESAKAAGRFSDQSLDFVFIDANHSFDHVMRDVIAWRPKVKTGGMLAGHDYGEPCGVKDAVDKIFGPDGVSVWGSVWYKVIS